MELRRPGCDTNPDTSPAAPALLARLDEAITFRRVRAVGCTAATTGKAANWRLRRGRTVLLEDGRRPAAAAGFDQLAPTPGIV